MIRNLLILFVLASTAFAQEQFTATVDRSSLRVGETLQVTFTFNGAVSGVSAPVLTSIEKLSVVGGPFTGTNVEIAPGRAISTMTFTYVLRANEQGKGTIGSAKIKYKGKEFSSQPISITIQSASSGASDNQSPGKQTNDVFIRVTPDKTTAFQGEQILLTYKIYFCVQITSPEILRLPRTAGFWVEEIPLPDHLELINETVNGKAYKAAVFRKLALFPTGAGDLEVEPLRIKTNVEVQSKRRSRDPFGMFFDRQMQPVEVESPKVNLRINPLPSSNVPAGFNGAVGSFQMKASLDRDKCTTHEAVTLSVNIEGYGNIATLAAPSVTFPPDFEHYDPKTTDNIRRERGKVSGSKVFEYVLIPRAPGLQKIPSISFSYFDTDKNRYMTLQSGDLELQVQKGNDNLPGSVNIPVAGKRGVESVATDIAYTKTKPGSFIAINTQPHQLVSFWTFTAGPWIALAGVVFATRRRMRLEAGSSSYRFRKTLVVALKKLAKAEKVSETGNVVAACGLIASSLENALAVKFELDRGTFTLSKLEELWTANGFDSDLYRRIERLLSGCNMSRFAVSALDRQSIAKMINEAKQILALVEKISVGRELS